MNINEVEQLRKVICEELAKQLEPIVNALGDIKLEIETLKKIDYNNIDQVTFWNNNFDLDNELKSQKNQVEPIDEIKQIIRNEISEATYKTWFADGLGDVIIEGDILIWTCTNNFTQDILEKRYKTLILSTCKEINLSIEEVKFEVANKIKKL